MSSQTSEIYSQDIDHLGIVAGIIDEIGIEEEINRLVGTHPLEKISAGQAVKAMILNGLGFLSAPVYLFEQFFMGKATETLIGEDVGPEHLNDSRLGRVLDDLYKANVTQIFLRIALKAYEKFGVNSQGMHLDATSFHVHGAYEEESAGKEALAGDPQESGETEPEAEQTLKPIHITQGYSRDHRPDLKQFVTDLICSGDGGVPCYLRVADGNEVDQAAFAQILKDFQSQWTMDVQVYIADAALYSGPNIATLGDIPWISRVPATVKEAKQLMVETPGEGMEEMGLEGYKFTECQSEYGERPQRWFVIESVERRQADLVQGEKRRQKQLETQTKALHQLSQKDFACATDAQRAAEKFSQDLRYHRLEAIEIVEHKQYKQPGRPRKGAEPTEVRYRIQAQLVEDEAVVQAAIHQAGRFILATNVLDEEALSAKAVLQEYKNQQYAERGFRFLKDPLFFASSVFLKLPRRVMALVLIMALCLLVYSLGERKLRQVLAQNQETVADQLRRPTQKPTLRWIFQCFQAVHLIWLDGVKRISNLTQERRRILQFFGPACEKYYLLC